MRKGNSMSIAHGIVICCKACKWGSKKPVAECETCYTGGFTPHRSVLYAVIDVLADANDELSKNICQLPEVAPLVWKNGEAQRGKLNFRIVDNRNLDEDSYFWIRITYNLQGVMADIHTKPGEDPEKIAYEWLCNLVKEMTGEKKFI